MDTPHEQTAQQSVRSAPRPPARRGGDGGGTPLRVYKAGQGQIVRWSTAVGGGIIAVAAAMFLREQLMTYSDSQYVLVLVPLALLLALAVVIYWFVGRNHTAVDFFIATEGEMKKVHWSSRREVIGATKVVIVTMLLLSGVLFAADIVFMILFSAMDVIQVDILGGMFGGAGE